MLGITSAKLARICKEFDADPNDEWELIEGEFCEFEPGQAGRRRFYEEGVMAIAKYLEETEGGSFLARLKEFFTHHRARVTRALVQRRIIQVTQDRSAVQIRGEYLFLQQQSVVRVLGTNGKGMVGTVRRIEQEDASLDGAEGLERGKHFEDFEDLGGRYWSQVGIVRLAKTMGERGRISKARKAWVNAVADVAEDCFEVQRKELESHEAKVKRAKDRVRQRVGRCEVSQQRPRVSDRNPLELEVHHLFDASTRPDLAALEDNLLVITSTLHRNFHKWLGNRPCEPKDFVDYLLRNELEHFDGTERVRAQGEKRRQKLIHRIELLQAKYEGNRLLY
jgi:AraC-like DNA-binding protein